MGSGTLYINGDEHDKGPSVNYIIQNYPPLLVLNAIVATMITPLLLCNKRNTRPPPHPPKNENKIKNKQKISKDHEKHFKQLVKLHKAIAVTFEMLHRVITFDEK